MNPTPITTPLAGYVVLDEHGDFLAWAACPLIAKRRLDSDATAERVERCSDGALLFYAPRGKFTRREIARAA